MVKRGLLQKEVKYLWEPWSPRQLVQSNLVNLYLQITWSGSQVLSLVYIFLQKKNPLNSNSCCCTPFNLNMIQKENMRGYSPSPTKSREELSASKPHLFIPPFSMKDAAHSSSTLWNLAFEKNRIGDCRRHRRSITPVRLNKQNEAETKHEKDLKNATGNRHNTMMGTKAMDMVNVQ